MNSTELKTHLEMIQSMMKQIAAKSGGVGASLPVELYIPFIGVVAQLSIAYQLALMNEARNQGAIAKA